MVIYSLVNGIVNLNSLPNPSSLITEIVPPCFSTNSLLRIKPSPLPRSLLVPSRECIFSIRKSSFFSFSEIPTPVSFTDISTNSFCISAFAITSPLRDVYLTALLNRLRKIVFNKFLDELLGINI